MNVEDAINVYTTFLDLCQKYIGFWALKYLYLMRICEWNMYKRIQGTFFAPITFQLILFFLLNYN